VKPTQTRPENNTAKNSWSLELAQMRSGVMRNGRNDSPVVFRYGLWVTRRAATADLNISDMVCRGFVENVRCDT
jgi:hypothetical protein